MDEIIYKLFGEMNPEINPVGVFLCLLIILIVVLVVAVVVGFIRR